VTLRLKDFVGYRCFAALDLASKTDIADLVLLFPPQKKRSRWTVFAKHYLPEDTVENGNPRYQAWFEDGWLTATPGNVTDFSYIADDLDEIKSKHELVAVPYDPFQATQFATERAAEGYPMLEYGATVKNFSEPMKQLEALVLQRAIDFEIDPVLMWMFGNVVARLDKKDNIFPNKEREGNKIDGVVALIMALACAVAEVDDGGSIYEKTAL
jgi:phage terminase large subunit-like protein